jgi:hypothetical protein
MNPSDPTSQIPVILHPQTEGKIIQAGLRSKIGEYWGLIHGEPPAPADPEARNRFSPECFQSRALLWI